MIVLNEHAVIEPHPVIVGAAHACRIFVELAQPGNGLARVEQHRAGTLDRIDIAAGQGGDPREVLERVERRALGGEHRTGIAGKAHQRRAVLRAFAVVDQQLELDVRIEGSEEGRRDLESRDHDRLPAIHLSREACIRRDRRVGCHVSPAAEIFCKDLPNETVDIQTLGKRHPAALVAGRLCRQAQ